ncbi:MAG: hypothetical protein P8N61_05305 [Porticoccaceae bacterium]|nr:hypothetical protein [Porticoccaceae bacterium]
MSQAYRNQYLQQMGIVQYVGKDLPVVSEQLKPQLLAQPQQPDIAVSAGADSSAAEFRVSRVNTAMREKSMAELVNIGLEDKAETPLTVVAQSTVTFSEPETAIELRLALWQPSDELLVCSSVEDSLPDPEQILLLGNILQTMGQGSSHLPQMDVVEWPPYPNMAGGESEVREFLATLIQARIDSKSAKIILLLGDAAAQWLLTPEQQAGVTNGQVDVFGQVTALLVPSLKAMIEQPSCKRETWQTIRFLSPQRYVHKAVS